MADLPATPDATDVAGEREYDLVLLGATGFTGRLTAEHLGRRLAGSRTRWAIAGRDRGRLEALAEHVSGSPGIDVVDTSDLVGLLDLAARTRVLASTVGPYVRHGELVVQACVRAATDYADITGEAAFVSLVRGRYDADARRRGVRVVTCCGFDSVPHDLGVRFTVGHLPDDGPITVRGYVRASGRISGGTARSAIEAVASRGSMRRRRGTSAGTGSPVRRGRPVTPLPARIHHVAELDAFGVPLPTIDASIVLRSARVLDGYGTTFGYGHFARVRTLPSVVAAYGVVGGAAALASFAPGRRLLDALLPTSGEGPDAATRAASRFDVTFLGDAGDTRVVTRVSGGDPGYGETSRMLGEAALSLAQDDGPEVAGVVTPAVGLGAPYHQRLVDIGIGFELLDRT